MFLLIHRYLLLKIKSDFDAIKFLINKQDTVLPMFIKYLMKITLYVTIALKNNDAR